MSNIRINKTPARLQIEARRERKTAQPASAFGSILATGGNALLRGVETAAGVVGGPLLSGAVSAAAGAIGGTAAGSASGAGAGNDGDVLDRARELQERAQVFNLQYLELQEQAQQKARRFTTLSNVARAEHDISKGILRNVSS